MKRRGFIWAACATLLTACGGGSKPKRRTSKFKVYRGPAVTGIIVEKRKRTMKLMRNGKVLRKYKVDLGFAPKGHKRFEGDGRTPEGLYRVNRDNPNSQFHLSLGISYPNRRDYDVARAMGRSPGGDIFIHGGPVRRSNAGKKDWTNGCIAVTDAEMEDIFAMVKVGTPIFIKP